MRDLLLVLVLPFLIYAAFRKPFIALSLWLWTSSFNINQLLYGFAASITYNKLFAGLTMLSFLFYKDKKNIKIDGLSYLIIIFFMLATLSTIFAIGFTASAWNKWELFAKIILFYFFAIAIINKRIHFDVLIWIFILSIGALAANEGLKFIFSGGNHRIGTLKAISGDNNFFGVMIVTLLPLAYYIYTQTKHKILKMGVMGVMVLMVLGIFSTYSRGAFLGLIVFAFFFWTNSNNKFLWLLFLVAVIMSMAWLMPDAWFGRMDTIETADTDGSFMNRVISWKMSILIAMDNFFGGGFKAVQTNFVWQFYALEFDKLDFIPSPEPANLKAAHSIYFQVLGNHGFIGLFFFLLILLTAYLKTIKIHHYALKNKMDNWIVELSKMLKLSLISYCVSGAAVNIAYFDFLYAILAMIAVLDSKIIAKSPALLNKGITNNRIQMGQLRNSRSVKPKKLKNQCHFS